MSRAHALAEKYKRDPVFIERSLEACRLAGVSEDYFINRYLKEDRSIPIDKDVDFFSRQLQIEADRKG